MWGSCDSKRNVGIDSLMASILYTWFCISGSDILSEISFWFINYGLIVVGPMFGRFIKMELCIISCIGSSVCGDYGGSCVMEISGRRD